MDQGPEGRASARSDEPAARSAARWRVRAAADTPVAMVTARWPELASCVLAGRWLVLQADLGRSPRTVNAYARALVDYLRFCERGSLDVAAVGRGEIAAYVRYLRERPGRRSANVVAIESGAGLANATPQLRITVVRLFYDFLVEEGVCDRNPVCRGRHGSTPGRGGERGLIARYSRLPWIPTDDQWRALLTVAAGESLRNRLMLALAYDAGLRREELCLLATDDLDPAHRTLRVRAETTKTRRGRVVPYSAVAGALLAGYLVHRRSVTLARRALLCRNRPATGGSRSRRGRGRRWCGRSLCAPRCPRLARTLCGICA